MVKTRNVFLKQKIISPEIKQEIRKEENMIFHRFKYLKKKHQIIFAVLISTGVIFVWRGLWNLMDYFWFPNYSLWSNLSGILLGAIILLLSHKLLEQLAGN